MISAKMLTVEIDEHNDRFVVNGVELDKARVLSLFPNNKDTALAKFLCACPAIADRADHLIEFHDLSQRAFWYVNKSKDVVQAIGLKGDNIPAFVMMALLQASTTPDELLEELEAIFGHCAADESKSEVVKEYAEKHGMPVIDGNVVKFKPKRTLH